MLRPPAIWDTPRLHLRPPIAADAEAIFRNYARDEQVTHYLPWRPHRSLADTHRFLERCQAVWQDGSAYPWGIELAGTTDLVGMAEIRIRTSAVDMGYVLARAHWGRGLMTEALRPVVAWGLGQPEIFRVWAVCDVDNTASRRVLERLGLQHEGVLRRWIVHPGAGQVPRDAHCYSVVK
jgi:RimJ/RimL family protein N-acetyltransferase